MIPIKGIFEVAIKVKDLPRAEAFYRDVLGLRDGIRDEKRNWLFMWAGADAGMVVLQEDPGEWPSQHFAFSVNPADLDATAIVLRDRGITVEGPVYHQWMGGSSLYFSDPDGHNLELFALGS